MSPVNRVTLFKIANEDNIPSLLDRLSSLKQDAQKNGSPFLQRAVAGRTGDDPRTQGYNVCLSVAFASMEDMQYYDDSCSAHDDLKAMLKGRVAGPPLVVYMENVVGQ